MLPVFSAPLSSSNEILKRVKRSNTHVVNTSGDFRGQTNYNGLPGYNSQRVNAGGAHQGTINFRGSSPVASFNTHEVHANGGFNGKVNFEAGEGTFNMVHLIGGQNRGSFDFQNAKPGSFNTVIGY